MIVENIISILDGLDWESQCDLGAYFLTLVCQVRKDFDLEKAYLYLKEKIPVSKTAYTNAVAMAIMKHSGISLELLGKLIDDENPAYSDSAAAVFLQHPDCTLEILVEHQPPSSEYYQEKVWKERVANKLGAMPQHQLELLAISKKYQKIATKVIEELRKRYKFMALKSGHDELIAHLLQIKNKRLKRIGAHQLGEMCSDPELIKSVAATLQKVNLTCEFFTGCASANNLSPQLAKELLETEKEKYARGILEYAAAKEN